MVRVLSDLRHFKVLAFFAACLVIQDYYLWIGCAITLRPAIYYEFSQALQIVSSSLYGVPIKK